MIINPRLIVFYVLFAAAIGYSICAFGTAFASYGHADTEYRVLARWLVLAFSITGLLILPRKNLLPKFPLIPLISFGVLIFWGLFMVINAEFDQLLKYYRLVEVKDRPFESAPGSIAKTTSRGLVLEVAIILAFAVLVFRTLETKIWKSFVGAFAVTGMSVAIIGLGHKLLGMETIFGIESFNGKEAKLPELFFAPFVYNANAASLMNLTLAMSLGLFGQAHRKYGFSRICYFWLVSVMVTSVGVLAAASKAGILILLAQFALYAVLEFRYWWAVFKKKKRGSKKGKKKVVSVEKMLLKGVAVIIFVGFTILFVGPSVNRFGTLITEVSDNKEGSATIEGRSRVRGVVWQLITDPERGWGGIGPGGFAHAYRYVVDPNDEILTKSSWQYAHCDPLQTILEWGYIGAAAWFVIGIGGVLRVSILIYRGRICSSNKHLIKGLVIGLVGVGIHSTYDFPLSLFSIHVVAIAACMILWGIPDKELAEQEAGSVPPVNDDEVRPSEA